MTERPVRTILAELDGRSSTLELYKLDQNPSETIGGLIEFYLIWKKACGGKSHAVC